MLTGDDPASLERSPGQPAFSLGDAPSTESVVRAAAFVDATFTAVHEPVHCGADVDGALDFVSRLASVKGAPDAQPPAERERTIGRLRGVPAAHCTRDGVWLDSRAWIVTARRG